MSRFDLDTAVKPLGPGLFEGRMDRHWWVFAGPNGGYVAAVALRALTAATGDPARPPRSLTVHYSERPLEGPVTIETRVERAGRSLSTVSARMRQEGRTLAVALAAFSASRDGDVPSFSDLPVPAVPPPDACPAPADLDDSRRPPIQRNFEIRWAIGHEPFQGTPPNGSPAEVGGWIRFRGPRPVDPLALAAYADAFPPAIWVRGAHGDRAVPSPMGIPTVDLTIHFRRPVWEQPSGAWTLARFRTNTLADGFLEEDGELWSEDGLLLAQSRQLALLL